MADSFDDMLMALLLIKEENVSEFTSTQDKDQAARWARYAFEAGRASARRGKKAVEVKDELNKAEIPNHTPATQAELDAIFNSHAVDPIPEELEVISGPY